MEKFTGKESFLSSYESSIYNIRSSLKFIKTTHHYRLFLQNLYRVVISPERWPEETLPTLQNNFEELLFALDAAWLEHEHQLQIEARYGSGDEEFKVDVLQPSFSDYTIDQYYPQLQESTWPVERNHRFKGEIQFLNQDEIRSSKAFHRKFFGRRSQGDWKRYLTLWMESALDDRSIIEAHGFSPAEIYEDYLDLVKLMEIVWLVEKQERELLYHELVPWFDMNNYPYMGTIESTFNPYSDLYGFFHYTSLMAYKRDLGRWMKLVFEREKIWEGTPADLIDLFKTLVHMTDCLWLIRQLGPNYPKSWNNTNTTYSFQHAPIPKENYRYKLEAEIIKNPENYLREFFDLYDLQFCFHILFESLTAALGHEEPYPFDKKEVTSFHANLVKLLEAEYLVQAKKYPNRQH